MNVNQSAIVALISATLCITPNRAQSPRTELEGSGREAQQTLLASRLLDKSTADKQAEDRLRVALTFRKEGQEADLRHILDSFASDGLRTGSAPISASQRAQKAWLYAHLSKPAFMLPDVPEEKHQGATLNCDQYLMSLLRESTETSQSPPAIAIDADEIRAALSTAYNRAARARIQ